MPGLSAVLVPMSKRRRRMCVAGSPRSSDAGRRWSADHAGDGADLAIAHRVGGHVGNDGPCARNFRSRRAVLIVALAGMAASLMACERIGPVAVAGRVVPSTAAAQDLAITTEAQARLAQDRRFARLEIQVQTSAGRVLLRGMVPDTVVRREAADIVRGVAGVVEVRNDLSVQWIQPLQPIKPIKP